MCAKEEMLFLTILDFNTLILNFVIFRPNETPFDMAGLLESVLGIFNDDFIAKVRDILSELKDVWKRTLVVKLMRLAKCLNDVRPKHSVLQQVSLWNTVGSQATLWASTVMPRATPLILEGKSPLPALAPSRGVKRSNSAVVASSSAKKPRLRVKTSSARSSRSH